LPSARHVRPGVNAGDDACGLYGSHHVALRSAFQQAAKNHRDFDALEKGAASILSEDLDNRTRRHHVKKLEGIALGEGQYRLSLGRWRFRYDIVGQVVWLYYCGLRREDTY